MNKDQSPVAGPKGELKRTIGTFSLACAVINITVGTGIFTLPALVAEHLGAAAILCFLICGILIFLIALCFAEVGSKVTNNGGVYAYIEAGFGLYAGFLANNIFWLSCSLSDAAVANALLKTLGYFYPPLDAAFRPLFLLLLFGMLAYINIRGAKEGVRAVIFITFAKLIPLLIITCLGITHINSQNLHWNNSFTIGDIGAVTLILFYAFLGIENAVANSGEFKNPPKVVPLGLLSGLLFVLVLYIAIQLMTQGILGSQLTLYKGAPITEVAKRLLGLSGIALITLAAAASMLGNLSGSILAIPRTLFAGARDGIFPKFLGSIHPRYATPQKAILIYAAIDYLFAVFGAFKQLVILSTASTLLIYLGVVLSSVKLRYKAIPGAGKTFTIPGGLTVPLLATVAIIWLLTTLSAAETIGILIALIALSVIYLLLKFFRDKKTGLSLKED